jgi:hypothetical protein
LQSAGQLWLPGKSQQFHANLCDCHLSVCLMFSVTFFSVVITTAQYNYKPRRPAKPSPPLPVTKAVKKILIISQKLNFLYPFPKRPNIDLYCATGIQFKSSHVVPFNSTFSYPTAAHNFHKRCIHFEFSS